MRPAFLCEGHGKSAMGQTACGLVASLIDWIEGPHSDHGRARCPTQAVVDTLRFFLREGGQWRELRATGDRVCSAMLRRRLREWSAVALLHRGARRTHSDGALGTRSGGRSMGCGHRQLQRARRARRRVDRAKPDRQGQAGHQVSPRRGERGHPAGRPACRRHVHDTRLFPGLLRRALVVCAAIARLYADAAYHSAENRRLCQAEGILPLIRERGEPHGSGLGSVRCVVEHANAWLLANKRLDRRNDRLTIIIDALLTAACIFVIANRLTD